MTYRWSHNPRTAPAGRFGGGWQLALGFRASRRTLMVELLVGTLRLHFPPRRPPGPVAMTQGEHGVERFDRVWASCPYCGFPARDRGEWERHLARHP